MTSLPPELLQKAQEELNERPEWRSRDIQALRDMVLAHPGKKVSLSVLLPKTPPIDSIGRLLGSKRIIVERIPESFVVD